MKTAIQFRRECRDSLPRPKNVSALLVSLIIWLIVRPVFAAETISFTSVPTILPRDNPLATYSPALCFEYGALNQGIYTLKVFLLEPGNFTCASNQWCERTFAIDNQGGTNASGKILVVEPMDVFGYPNFLWVADLYSPANVKVAAATQAALVDRRIAHRLGRGRLLKLNRPLAHE